MRRGRGRWRALVLVKGAVALSVITIVAANVIGGGGGAATANLWIDTSGGTCTRQATPAAYSDAAACSSLSAAYAAASTGDTVLWKAGSYSGQTLLNATSKSVTFQSAPGEAVATTDVALYNADNITIRGDNSSGRTNWISSTTGLDIDGQNNGSGTVTDQVNSNDTLEYVKAQHTGTSSGGTVFIRASQTLTMRHMEVGPSDPDDGIKIWQPDPINSASDNSLLIEDLFIHDVTHNGNATVHDDGISIQGCASCVLRYVNGYSLGTQAFYPSGFGTSGDEGSITLEDSTIGATQSYGTYAVNANSWAGTMTFRNNTFGQAANLETNAPSTTWVGNVWTQFASFNCGLVAGRAASWKYNVYPQSCSGADSTNKVVAGIASQVVGPDGNASTWDGHLNSGSGAIDMTGFNLASDCATTDIDAASRPVNSLCDAGADEFGAP